MLSQAVLRIKKLLSVQKTEVAFYLFFQGLYRILWG